MQTDRITSSVDSLARRFSAKVSAKEGDSQLISTSALVGGYLHLLCSVIRVTEQTDTCRDGFQVENDYNAYNIEARFKYILICRLQVLVDEIMDANRLNDLGNKDIYRASNAYGAAVILRRELNYFKGNIRSGGLHESVRRPARGFQEKSTDDPGLFWHRTFTFQVVCFRWTRAFGSHSRRLWPLSQLAIFCDRRFDEEASPPRWNSHHRHASSLEAIHQEAIISAHLSPPDDWKWRKYNGYAESHGALRPCCDSGPVANIDFESLMFENTEFGEMGLATLSQHHESPHQFPPESSDGTSLGTSSSLSGFSEEATMDPRYLSNTDWYYPGNF
jgi:hypothetical protein